MKRVDSNKEYLYLIAWSPSRVQRQSLLKTASQDQVLALSEIVLNALSGNIKLSDRERSVLQVYKKELRKIGSSKKVKWQHRKKPMMRVGKAIQTIVQKVIPQYRA